MNIQILPAGSLSSDQIEAWGRIRDSNPALDSPYFFPEFTLAVARSRENVQVAVLEDRGRLIGFFPFEKLGNGVAGPVGETFSDLHGVVIEPGVSFDFVELVRACGVKIFDFDHLIADQSKGLASHPKPAESPTMDLSEGFEAYCAMRREAGSRKISQTRRKARKMEREVGTLRFEPQVKDEEVLQRVIDWKREQCQRTGTRDYFAEDWALTLVRDLYRTQGEDFGGLLSALFVDGRVAAAHFGLWSRDVVHWWFPVYDPDFSAYSPGSILLLDLAEYGAGEGRKVLELGKGGDAYKLSFMTGARPIAEGSVVVPSLRGLMRRSRVASERLIRESGWAAPIRVPVRAGLRWVRDRKRGG